ncbi:MAG: helix-turn-helix domain-containing protein, partial [Oscillospiraceae bacterium]|nr:helix-turn-helix domain-containing protein [Oscillospiraceae bacterium]
LRGDRVKRVLKEEKKSQKWLAEKLFLKPEHLNMMLNGKRPLGEDKIQTIASLFPNRAMRIGWLLGYEDYETDYDIIAAKGQEFLDTEDAIIELMRFSAKLLGYQLEWSGVACKKGDSVVVQEYDPDEVIFDLIKGHARFEITAEEDRNFRDELTRYAVFLIEGLIHKKNDTWHPFTFTKEMLDNG